MSSSSSSSSAAGFASAFSDSNSSMSTTSFSDSTSTMSCYFDPSTCQRQLFSFPDKIVYYIAKNVSNSKTFKKLIETCKYFFVVNPVIVVSSLCCYVHEWKAYYDDEDGKYSVGFKYDQPIHFKIWVTHKFSSFFGVASQLIIPLIYKNDATVIGLQSGPIKFKEFLFLAGNAEELTMIDQVVNFENEKTAQLEDIVKSVPKLKILDYISVDGHDFNTNTANQLMEIEHFKNISRFGLRNIPETLNAEAVFNFIIENMQIEVDLYYVREISDQCKELIREYTYRLQNEEGCNSRIGYVGMQVLDVTQDGISDNSSFGSFDDDNFSDVDENEDFLFPWNNEDDEEWELPWDLEN